VGLRGKHAQARNGRAPGGVPSRRHSEPATITNQTAASGERRTYIDSETSPTGERRAGYIWRTYVAAARGNGTGAARQARYEARQRSGRLVVPVEVDDVVLAVLIEARLLDPAQVLHSREAIAAAIESYLKASGDASGPIAGV
jgi:hypothetical protein